MSKVTNIETRGHMRKLRFGESWIDRGFGWERAVSSEMLDIFAQLQALLDDLVLEHGISGARKIVNNALDAAIQDWQRDQT